MLYFSRTVDFTFQSSNELHFNERRHMVGRSSLILQFASPSSLLYLFLHALPTNLPRRFKPYDNHAPTNVILLLCYAKPFSTNPTLCCYFLLSFLSLLVLSLRYNRIFLMGDFHFPALFSQALVILQLLFSSHNAAVALAP